MNVWTIIGATIVILGFCFGVFYTIKDVRKVKQNGPYHQSYIWYKRWPPLFMLAIILMITNNFILNTFFPHDLLERIIDAAIAVFSLILLVYSMLLLRNERLSQGQ